MQINILTLFPEFFTTALRSSILGRAQAVKLVNFKIINIRDFATGKHQVTDDRPFGGGPGMVMKVDIIDKALTSLDVAKGRADSKIILTSAKGDTFTQQAAVSFSQLKQLTIICGHYEGVDERVAENLIDAEIRIGDYVLTGGEPAALVMSDAVVRLIDGVLGNEESNKAESHSEVGKFSHPVYTKPREYKGWVVPEVLLSGDHGKIKEWRKNY